MHLGGEALTRRQKSSHTPSSSGVGEKEVVVAAAGVEYGFAAAADVWVAAVVGDETVEDVRFSDSEDTAVSSG